MSQLWAEMGMSFREYLKCQNKGLAGSKKDLKIAMGGGWEGQNLELSRGRVDQWWMDLWWTVAETARPCMAAD
jgi:hypothetical protein